MFENAEKKRMGFEEANRSVKQKVEAFFRIKKNFGLFDRVFEMNEKNNFEVNRSQKIEILNHKMVMKKTESCDDF